MLARERRIIKLREQGHSLEAMGEQLGSSGERVRQIEWSVQTTIESRETKGLTQRI